MTRKLKRTENFELGLEITNDDFIRPPKNSQRNALLNNALKEFCEDLQGLDKQARDFVAGNTLVSSEDRTQTDLTDSEIMEDWQIPVMQEMTQAVTKNRGKILEVGFGRGISSTMIQEQNVSSHTIIECNDSVIAKFKDWARNYEDSEIEIVRGLWQENIDKLGLFDGIFFHTYPLNEAEYMEYVHGSVTFAEHFFTSAAKHLSPGGCFTYFSNEIDSLSRGHQRALFENFSSISLKKIDIEVPVDVRDTWWANSIVIVCAVK